RSWFAHHTVRGLRAHVQLDRHFFRQIALLQVIEGGVQSSILRRTRIFFVVTLEKSNVFGPRVAFRVGDLRLERNESCFPLLRKNNCVISLHAPIVRKIKDIIWRTHDQRVEVLLLHQSTDAAQLFFVSGPRHCSPPRAYCLLYTPTMLLYLC